MALNKNLAGGELEEHNSDRNGFQFSDRCTPDSPLILLLKATIYR